MTAEERDPLEAFSVVSGDPTPEELAAVTAVVDALLEEAGQQSRRSPGPSAWAISQRATRAMPRPGHGAWRGFSA